MIEARGEEQVSGVDLPDLPVGVVGEFVGVDL